MEISGHVSLFSHTLSHWHFCLETTRNRPDRNIIHVLRNSFTKHSTLLPPLSADVTHTQHRRILHYHTERTPVRRHIAWCRRMQRRCGASPRGWWLLAQVDPTAAAPAQHNAQRAHYFRMRRRIARRRETAGAKVKRLGHALCRIIICTNTHTYTFAVLELKRKCRM